MHPRWPDETSDMRLSSFDPSWYAAWPVHKTASEEWSRPGLTNFLGSLQAGGDVSSLRHVIFPPVSGAEESTAYLTVDGTFLAATRLQTKIRWRPWCVERTVRHGPWRIHTHLCLPPGEHAALQRIVVSNTTDTARNLSLALRLSGRCVNRGELSLLGVLEDLAFDWRSRRVDALGLADYGPKEELLECVSTYEHVVAGLNAGTAWMLRRLAEAYRALGRTTEAAALDAEADALVADLQRHLYVEGGGWFRCILPDGRRREVRHCWDTGMVLMCIGLELPETVRREIVHFFRTELQTPSWIRALSPHDGDAAVSGNRADHQFNGAVGSWPAEVALGLLHIGERDLVTDWLHGIARTARQGPFGQAHYDEGVVEPTHDGATKVTEELPQCCHWSNISGALFFSVMEAWLQATPDSSR